MKVNYIIFAVFKYLFDIGVLATMIFLSAGTLNFIPGIVLVGTLLILGLVYGIYMRKNHPELLKKRLVDRENNMVQLFVMMAALVVLCASVIASGFSHRYGWPFASVWRYPVCLLLAVCGIILYMRVIKENSFLSTAIKVDKKQTVIETGPYRFVRHPMYTAMLLLFMAAELLLGSFLSLIISLGFIPIAVIRILNEEKNLKINLSGYDEYLRKTKYRLIPYIW